jgi:hypothetical protein
MKSARILAVSIAILGIIDSGYLLISEFISACPVCVSIRVFSLPSYLPALFGFCWFAFALVVFSGRIPRAFVKLWSFSGVYGVAFLATYAVLNSYFCPFCFAAYAFGIFLIAISEMMPSVACRPC